MSLLDETLKRLLVCPRCRGDLEEREAESALLCRACLLRYDVIDGVPNMIIRDATPVADDPKG